MSWHFLQAQAAVSSEAISWDGVAFVPSKLKTTLDEYCLPDNVTEPSLNSLYGMTLERLTDTRGGGVLMWCQGGSRVRTYQPQAKALELTGRAVACGPKWPGSLARYNPALYSWKTRRCSFREDFIKYSEIWPRWGMMHDGECFPLTRQGPRTNANESGLWPTPTKQDSWSCLDNAIWHGAAPYVNGVKRNTDLRHYLLHLGREDLAKSPTFREWLMGWPISWTDLAPLATDKFLQWFDLHGTHCVPCIGNTPPRTAERRKRGRKRKGAGFGLV